MRIAIVLSKSMQNIHIMLAQAAGNTTKTNITLSSSGNPMPETSIFSGLLDSGAFGLLIEGGVFMWPILAMALIGLAVIIERWRSLKMLAINNSELKENVLNELTEDRAEDALKRCEQATGPVAIGYTYEEQSNKNNAIKWFQRTCKLFPRSRNASKAHSHLQKEYGISVTLGGSKEK